MSPAVTLSPPSTATLTECPNCGAEVHTDAKRRIAELEGQVRILSEKASNAVDRLADYEDELKSQRERQPPPSPTPAPASTTSSAPLAIASATNRISAFLTASRPRGNGAPPPSPPPDNPVMDALLEKERQLRRAAEARLDQVTSEMEELSASLFQNANEMVANERRERSKLEERIKILEKRDEAVKQRLGLLERAVDRINRVREVLAS